ncbi:MAG: DUF4013 domain-containing protein [Pirellulaceae bacterium]
MTSSAPNPFTAPASAGKPGHTPPSNFTIDYLKNFTFMFESPNWLLNVLFCTLAIFVPILGPIVLLGYQFYIGESLLRNPGSRYPDFDFNRLGDYIGRGIWPFLVVLAANLLMFPVIAIIYVLFFVIMAAAAGQGDAGFMAIPFIFLILGALCSGILFAVVSQPMMLRSALTQDFLQGFNFGFVFAYLSKVWVELLIGMAIIICLTPILAILGVLVVCVGYFAAIAIGQMAYGYLNYQAYRLYLARGGEPIPLKYSN